jgi:hypothetical protein
VGSKLRQICVSRFSLLSLTLHVPCPQNGDTPTSVARRCGHQRVLDLFSKFGADLLSSVGLEAAVWEAVVSESPGGWHPPPPFSLCPWSRFIKTWLPPIEAAELARRFVDARASSAGCFAFVSSRSAKLLTGAVGLWPIRDTVRDFLTHTRSVRLQLRTIQPLLSSRSAPLCKIR